MKPLALSVPWRCRSSRQASAGPTAHQGTLSCRCGWARSLREANRFSGLLSVTRQRRPGRRPRLPIPLIVLSRGTDLVLAARFEMGNGFAVSATGASPRMAGFLSQPAFAGEPFHTLLLNAGVVRLPSDGVLFGFIPPDSRCPRGLDGFAVRISLSNVCAK